MALLYTPRWNYTEDSITPLALAPLAVATAECTNSAQFADAAASARDALTHIEAHRAD